MASDLNGPCMLESSEYFRKEDPIVYTKLRKDNILEESEMENLSSLELKKNLIYRNITNV